MTSIEGRPSIVFEVETSRVLEILSSEIYDSSYALLRENIQNAYDAILMRKTADQNGQWLAQIAVSLDGQSLSIADNGIGMTEEVLRNNFWKAGSSGKRTEFARRSGVIGTFGIGAMANFGVCTELTVETTAFGGDTTLVSKAVRDNLSISNECIDLHSIREGREAGTVLHVTLDDTVSLDEGKARSYLEPYVRYIPIPVLLNGGLISQESVGIADEQSVAQLLEGVSEQSGCSAVASLAVAGTGNVILRLTDITLDGSRIEGELFLRQNGGQLMGYRSWFGLAPVPVSGHYDFGGVANLATLTPTAGREALSRESIGQVQRLIRMAERWTSEQLAETDVADRNTSFIDYARAHNRIDLANRVTVDVLPEKKSVPLGELLEYFRGKPAYYYTGRHQSVLSTFSSADTYLVHISKANPRRAIQLAFVRGLGSIPEVPDSATVRYEFEQMELTLEEAAFLIRVTSTISEDYLLPEVEVRFADISHDVLSLLTKEPERLLIHIARDASSVRAVLECYRTAADVFDGFIKDFVRTHLYERIRQDVPSSTRGGADALAKQLQRNQELYRVEESELGKIEPLLAGWLSGDISIGEVLATVRKTHRAQTQHVSSAQVGRVENEIPDVVQSPSEQSEKGNQFEAAPPILREEISSSMKVLFTDTHYGQLNGFQRFLGLSDRVFKRERDFFRAPHTTRVVWASHRILYIFTHISERITFYYDLELRDSIEDGSAHGERLPTTTIVTRNRIYVPVPPQLVDVFRVDGSQEFFVRYDTIAR